MIDVVFLLLVFFMLAASFEERVFVRLSAAGTGGAGDAPRLIDVSPNGLRLNGIESDIEALILSLGDTPGENEGVIVLRPRGEADIQRVLDVMSDLTAAGFNNLALVE